MNESRPNGILNGHKVPLLIQGGMLLPIAGVLIALWADVQQLKSDRAERVSPERMATLEATMQQGVDNRYRAGDAVRDFALRDAQIQRLREDLKVLEDRLERENRR